MESCQYFELINQAHKSLTAYLAHDIDFFLPPAPQNMNSALPTPSHTLRIHYLLPPPSLQIYGDEFFLFYAMVWSVCVYECAWTTSNRS